MRATIVAALLALASSSAFGQSADPAKRNEWARSMSQCLQGLEIHPEEMREALGQVCRSFANEEIRNTPTSRLLALLRTTETVEEPRSERIVTAREEWTARLGELGAGRIKLLEVQIRYAALEECWNDPAGFSREDCNRIIGLDRIRELMAANEDEMEGEREGE